jgi:tRNA N6-adenosine threonylcarbamoyltransferase
MTRILGIETSCDETAAAVVEDRSRVLSSIVASQVAAHSRYGGVVPEIAARHHVEAIEWVVRQALDESGAGLEAIDAIAVTQGPGLVGSLLVGLSAGKAIAWHRGLPLLAVHHLEGHVRSVFLEHPGIEFPAIALVVSGGHTTLFLCPEEDVYRTIARTRDDAAGEAFDKVAKLLGLGYPGGPVIERLSRGADDRAYDFPQAQMKDHSIDFSFSGLKTAVRRAATRDGLVAGTATVEAEVPQKTRDLAASFQRAVVRVLVKRTIEACRRERIRTLLVTGGVACNGPLREAFAVAASDAGLAFYLPSPRYTTDNAAMIAAAGFLHLERGRLAGFDLSADPGLRLG